MTIKLTIEKTIVQEQLFEVDNKGFAYGTLEFDEILDEAIDSRLSEIEDNMDEIKLESCDIVDYELC
jgi:hypothetical protein